ncbi:MAG: hypothetical protein KGY54_12035 [Oleiphilaceae bacterium]|nr:hypothetical protein [Oleiphilaceae bacterium]
MLTTTTLFLAGCQTSGYMSAAATDGDGVTCNEIYRAFDAYERDRQSAQALTELSQLVSPTAGAIAAQGVSSAEGYYGQVRNSANVALAIKGCEPVRR